MIPITVLGASCFVLNSRMQPYNTHLSWLRSFSRSFQLGLAMVYRACVTHRPREYL